MDSDQIISFATTASITAFVIKLFILNTLYDQDNQLLQLKSKLKDLQVQLYIDLTTKDKLEDFANLKIPNISLAIELTDRAKTLLQVKIACYNALVAYQERQEKRLYKAKDYIRLTCKPLAKQVIAKEHNLHYILQLLLG